MDVHLLKLAERQRDMVAAWQLLRVGWTRAMVDQHVADHPWRVVHSGVYALTQAPLTLEQLRIAATLTAPDSFLSHASGGAHYGIWRIKGAFETIVRPGTRGPQTCDGLFVSYSKTLAGDTTIHDGIPITTPARTVIDLAAHGDPARMLREALRLRLVTPNSMAVALERHRNRRGTKRLKALLARYGSLPYERTRSNPEAFALEVLHDAGAPPPDVNRRIAGEEADLSWSDRRLIIEIDGPQYHRITEEDARKERVWQQAGYTVRRISSDVVYADPGRLVALAIG